MQLRKLSNAGGEGGGWERPLTCSAGGSTEAMATDPPVICHFTAACPVLCSGNGQYSKGRCLCFSGWKGTECDVPTTQCIDPQCGGRGICIMGSCACNSGYKGENCEEGKHVNIY